jgi:hypothetical protein
MKNGRTIQEWQRPLAFLGGVPLRWLIARGQIQQFATDTPVGEGDQSANRAFLVLSGSCELRRKLGVESELEILHTFKQGETIGSFLRPSTTTVAAEDGTVFCIRLQALMDLSPKVNSHSSSSSSESSDTTRFTFTLHAPKGKLAPLAFFSDSLPETFLAESIARPLGGFSQPAPIHPGRARSRLATARRNQVARSRERNNL